MPDYKFLRDLFGKAYLKLKKSDKHTTTSPPNQITNPNIHPDTLQIPQNDQLNQYYCSVSSIFSLRRPVARSIPITESCVPTYTMRPAEERHADSATDVVPSGHVLVAPSLRGVPGGAAAAPDLSGGIWPIPGRPRAAVE